MVVVSCGDDHTESGSAGIDTIQAQGWSVVERKQAFAELEAAKKNVRPLNLQPALRLPVAHACAMWIARLYD